VSCSRLVLVWWENQQEINTPQYKPILTRTSRNSKPQQAIYSPTYRKALYLLCFLVTGRAGTAPNTPERKNTIDNLKKFCVLPKEDDPCFQHSIFSRLSAWYHNLMRPGRSFPLSPLSYFKGVSLFFSARAYADQYVLYVLYFSIILYERSI